MTKEEIQGHYKTHIIPESKAPFHFEKPQQFQKEFLAYNPLCGDKYHLYLGTSTLHFHGIGCALSQASGSLLARAAENLSPEKLKVLVRSFLQSLDLNEEIDDELPEAVQVLAALKHFEGRIDCIKLPWQALLDELNN